jgi:hypothetical protein
MVIGRNNIQHTFTLSKMVEETTRWWIGCINYLSQQNNHIEWTYYGSSSSNNDNDNVDDDDNTYTKENTTIIVKNQPINKGKKRKR